jgi:hypothetical protein
MEITNNLMEAAVQSSFASALPQSPESDFTQYLQSAQAPPGPEPPPPPNPINTQEKEQKTIEPNAQSKKPDLSSDKNDEADNRKKIAAHAIEVAQGLQTAEAVLGAVGNVLATQTDSKIAPDPKTGLAVVAPGTDTTAVDKTALVSLTELPKDAAATIVSAKSTPDLVDAKAAIAPTANAAIAGALSDAKASIKDAIKVGPTTPGATPPTSTKSTPLDLKTADATTTSDAPVVSEKPSSDTKQGSQGDSTQQQPQDKGAAHAGPTFTLQGAPIAANAQTETAAPASTQVSTASQAVNVIRDISAHADKLGAVRSAENVTVHLQSDDQTDVTVVVKSLRGNVQTQIMTNNDALKNALHQNKPQLSQAFQQKGMNLSQASVGMQGGSKQSAQNAQQDRSKTFSTKQQPSRTSNQNVATASQSTSGVDLSI